MVNFCLKVKNIDFCGKISDETNLFLPFIEFLMIISLLLFKDLYTFNYNWVLLLYFFLNLLKEFNL